jgi:hypothetical protein
VLILTLNTFYASLRSATTDLMRSVLTVVLLTLTAFACKKAEPQEYEAVITAQDFTFCGGCGGWIVHVLQNNDTTMYRADVPPPFDKPKQQVLIRYEKDEIDGLKTAGRWIKLKSIRKRE